MSAKYGMLMLEVLCFSSKLEVVLFGRNVCFYGFAVLGKFCLFFHFV